MQLKFLGVKQGRYSGFDNGKIIAVKAGDSIDVSEATAKRLLNDFPEDWKPAAAPVQADAPSKVKEEKTSAPSAEPLEVPSGKKPQKNKAIAPKKAKRK